MAYPPFRVIYSVLIAVLTALAATAGVFAGLSIGMSSDVMFLGIAGGAGISVALAVSWRIFTDSKIR